MSRIILITGMSGAGLSTALRVFEDCGYEAIDNLRLFLLPMILDPTLGLGHRVEPPLALGIDSRTRDFDGEKLLESLERLSADHKIVLLFLDCSDEVLAQRFGDTRRPHPLAADLPISDGVARERQMLMGVRSRADHVIDTTETSIYDLRRQLINHFGLDDRQGLRVFINSFSFRRGLPRTADVVFDVRFLTNPYWTRNLRPLCGLDRPVQDFIVDDPDFEGYFSHVTGLLTTMLRRWQQDGKSYLTVAIGCTGGRHRSVFVATRLAQWLTERQVATHVMLEHRDLKPS